MSLPDLDLDPEEPTTETSARSRREELIRRDLVLGLQAEVDTARRRADDLEQQLERTAAVSRERRDRIDRLRERVERLDARAAALEEELAVTRRGGFVRRGARAARRALSRR